MKDRISTGLTALYTIREKPIYQKYARELVERRSILLLLLKQRLDNLRNEAAKAMRCFDMTATAEICQKEVEEKLQTGMPYVFVRRFPLAPPVSLMSCSALLQWKTVLWKTVYSEVGRAAHLNLANVIDDHLMKINPVVRAVSIFLHTEIQPDL